MIDRVRSPGRLIIVMERSLPLQQLIQPLATTWQQKGFSSPRWVNSELTVMFDRRLGISRTNSILHRSTENAYFCITQVITKMQIFVLLYCVIKRFHRGHNSVSHTEGNRPPSRLKRDTLFCKCDFVSWQVVCDLFSRVINNVSNNNKNNNELLSSDLFHCYLIIIDVVTELAEWYWVMSQACCTVKMSRRPIRFLGQNYLFYN